MVPVKGSSKEFWSSSFRWKAGSGQSLGNFFRRFFGWKGKAELRFVFDTHRAGSLLHGSASVWQFAFWASRLKKGLGVCGLVSVVLVVVGDFQGGFKYWWFRPKVPAAGCSRPRFFRGS